MFLKQYLPTTILLHAIDQHNPIPYRSKQFYNGFSFERHDTAAIRSETWRRPFELWYTNFKFKFQMRSLVLLTGASRGFGQSLCLELLKKIQGDVTLVRIVGIGTWFDSDNHW